MSSCLNSQRSRSGARLRGLIRWYLKPIDGAYLLSVLRRLDSLGLLLRNPGTARFYVLDETLGHQGEQIETTPEEALSKWPIHVERSISAQLWLTEADSLTVWCEGLATSSRVTFFLNGLDLVEADSVSARVMWAALTDVQTIGAIVDRDLEDDVFEWDAFFARGGVRPREPDLFWKRTGDHTIELSISTNIFRTED